VPSSHGSEVRISASRYSMATSSSRPYGMRTVTSLGNAGSEDPRAASSGSSPTPPRADTATECGTARRAGRALRRPPGRSCSGRGLGHRRRRRSRQVRSGPVICSARVIGRGVGDVHDHRRSDHLFQRGANASTSSGGAAHEAEVSVSVAGRPPAAPGAGGGVERANSGSARAVRARQGIQQRRLPRVRVPRDGDLRHAGPFALRAFHVARAREVLRSFS